MKPFAALVFTLIIANVDFGICMDCYSCNIIKNDSSCHSLAVCQPDHVCSIVSNGIGLSTWQCPNIDSKTTTISPVSIIGRDVTSLSCDKCCAVNACNKDICLNNPLQIDAPCADDPTFNCAQVSAVMNLCANKQNAKTVCRKYCGLCDLIDGAWSSWSAWGSCDVSCSNGTSTRMRACDNPTPANGGLPCSENNTEQRQCYLDACPVHGGWSTWTQWGVCSVTCGVGLQRKERTCSNPYPSLSGNHCFGDNSAYNTCSIKACAALHVAFFVNTPNGTLVGTAQGNVPIFENIVTNVGGGYNTSTGIFTCPVSGLYHFSLSVGAAISSSPIRVYCYIKRNNGSSIGIVDNTAHSEGNDQASESFYLELHVGETVYPDCTLWDNVNRWINTMFSGALVSQ